MGICNEGWCWILGRQFTILRIGGSKGTYLELGFDNSQYGFVRKMMVGTHGQQISWNNLVLSKHLTRKFLGTTKQDETHSCHFRQETSIMALKYRVNFLLKIAITTNYRFAWNFLFTCMWREIY